MPAEGENMFGSIGFTEIILIIALVALLFGGKKLPQLGKGLGEGITNFKNALLGKDEKKEGEEESNKNEKAN